MGRRHWVALGGLAATWGASYLFVELALEDYSSAFIAFGRTALAALVLVPIAWRTGAFRGLRGRSTDVAILALVQIAVPFLLIAEGQHHIPSALAGILVASAPIFTALLALRLDAEERMEGWSAVGIAVGIVGIVLLFGVDLSGDAMAVLGGGMVLLAGFGYALGGFHLKRRLGDARPAGVAAASMVVAAAVTLPFALATAPDEIGAGSTAALGALGAIGTGVAFLVFYSVIAAVGPSRAMLVAYLAPGFAVVYGATLLGEDITAATVAGLGLILAGSYLGAEGRPPWRRAGGPLPEPAATDALATSEETVS